MAEFTIRYDQSQDAAFSEAMAQKARQDAMLQQQAEANQRRLLQEIQHKQEAMKLIQADVLNPKLEVEIADAAIGQVRNNVATYMKQNPNASSAELNQYINSELEVINSWNNNVKLIKQRIENQFKDVKEDAISINNWKHAALTRALYKTNQDGSRSLRGVKELDSNYDYASDVWAKNGESFVDIKKSSDALIEGIKKAPTVKQDVTVTVGATRNSKGFTRQDKVEVPSYATWDGANNKLVVKRGKDGLIDDGVYRQFIGQPNSAFDLYLNIEAKNGLKNGFVDIKPEEALNPDGSVKNIQLFNEARLRVLNKLGVTGPLSKKYEDDVNRQTVDAIRKGDPIIGITQSDVLNPDGTVKDQEMFGKIKKTFLGNYIEQNSPYLRYDKDVTQPSKSETRIINITQTGEVPMINASGNIIAKMQKDAEAGRPYTQVNTLGTAERNSILKEARNAVGVQSIGVGDIQLQIDADGNPGIYTARDITQQGSDEVLYKAGTYLGPIDVQTDINANKQLGTKSAQKAVQSAKGKVIPKAEFLAMPLADRIKFKESGGTYN